MNGLWLDSQMLLPEWRLLWTLHTNLPSSFWTGVLVSKAKFHISIYFIIIYETSVLCVQIYPSMKKKSNPHNKSSFSPSAPLFTSTYVPWSHLTSLRWGNENKLFHPRGQARRVRKKNVHLKTSLASELNNTGGPWPFQILQYEIINSYPHLEVFFCLFLVSQVNGMMSSEECTCRSDERIY